MKIKVNLKEFNKKNIKLDRQFTIKWKQLFSKYGKLITDRASIVHRYKNQTGVLSKSNKYRVVSNGSKLTIRNTAKYSKWVNRWEKSKGGRGWMVNAINYYRKNMKADFEKASKHFK